MNIIGLPGDLEPESRFTAATDLCPHPERWTSTDGDSTEEEVCALVYGLVRGLQPDAVLETGTGFGAMAERISDALAANGQGRLYTVELDPDRVAYARERLGAAHTNVEVVHGDSLSWAPPLGVVFDFAWFDSYYPLRVPEFLYFRRWMRRGSIVGFHDTAPGHGAAGLGSDSIRTAVSSGLREEIRFVHLPTPRGVTIGEAL